MSHGELPSPARHRVAAALSQIVGLPLAAAGRAADMRMFEFGSAFALHVQCPWRIDDPDGIVTGRSDLSEPVDPDAAGRDPEPSPNLQDVRLERLLARHGPSLVVTGVDADDHGGAAVRLGHGVTLRLFPAGTRGEDWRLFRPGTDAPHFVVSGGGVEPDDEDGGPTA